MIQFKSRILYIFVILNAALIFSFSSCVDSFILPNTYVEINLNEPPGSRPFTIKNQPLEVFQVIERAANDKNVSGIILNICNISAGRDYLWELRAALEQFKTSEKKLYAYIGNADMDIYLLASVADKIIMHELGGLGITGYAIGRGYMKQTFEKLGIGVRELRYFEYKTAAESYTRDSFSEADRRQYNEYLDDIFNLSRDTLIQARGWTAQEFENILNNEFMYSARAAKEKGFVDYVGGFSEVNSVLYEFEEMSFPINYSYALFGKTETSLTGAMLPYNPPRASGSAPVIAIVYAEGQTDMTGGMSAAKLSRTIHDLANNGQVKAIVLRVNSPGGAADAADYVNEAVRYAKIYKPVVVSMGEVAASGGYWVSMSASHITANPYTITGSIGVIGTWFYDNGLNSKIGFKIDTLKRGAHSDLNIGFLVPYRNLTAQEEAQYKKYITDLYNIFTEKVTNARYSKEIDIEKAAQGRIFSGTRAMEEGLIDSVGGLSDAIKIARELAYISDEQSVRFKKYPEPTFMEKLMEKMPDSVSAALDNKLEHSLTKEIQYRLEKNGQVLPILPMDFLIN